MTPDQIKLVQDSFARVRPIVDTAAELFYGRLFELDPSLRSMFSENMTEQGRKLMTMVGVSVNNLNKLQMIVPAVQKLGVSHAGYGVKPEHYGTVAEALLWTFEKAFGDDWTPELKAAWTETYMLLATTMQDAAREAQSAA